MLSNNNNWSDVIQLRVFNRVITIYTNFYGMTTGIYIKNKQIGIDCSFFIFFISIPLPIYIETGYYIIYVRQ